MTLPQFRDIVDTSAYTAKGSRQIKMTNLIGGMLRLVDGVDGVKSGFTEQAGHTGVYSATRDGHRVYVVVLDSARREDDAADMLNWAFDAFDWHAPASSASAAPASGGSTVQNALQSQTAGG
jgi:D-alanyl-D-alanine carboxypeptidase